MASIKGLREVAYFDCAGGGRSTCRATTPTSRTWTPRRNRRSWTSAIRGIRGRWRIPIPDGVHTHKVRVENDLMLVNWECPPPYILGENFQGRPGHL